MDFQFPLQEFRKINSGIESKEAEAVDKVESLNKEEFFKDKNFEIVR